MILTLVGLIPVAGSLIKGIFKVLFNSIRKAALAGKITLKAIDAAVSLFNRFIDMTVVQATMKYMRIYNPYQYAEKQVRELIAQLNVSVLLTKFDELMEVTGSLLDKAKSWGRNLFASRLRRHGNYWFLFVVRPILCWRRHWLR